MRPVLLLPEELLPEDLLPEDLLPEDLVELLLVVVLPLDPDELLLFLTPLSREELLFVLLFLELPLSLFPEFLVERADVPERVEVFFLTEDLLRLRPVSLCFASLSERRVRTRFSSSEPMFFRPVVVWFFDLVDLLSKFLWLVPDFRAPSL